LLRHPGRAVSRLSATNRSGAARSHLSTSNGFLADQLLHVRCGIAWVDACSEVAVGTLELQRGNSTRASHRS
jgi:hypothetical protein